MISKEGDNVGKRIIVFLATIFMLVTVSGVANAGDSQDLDNQRWRVSGDCGFPIPAGISACKGATTTSTSIKTSDLVVIRHLPAELTTASGENIICYSA